MNRYSCCSSKDSATDAKLIIQEIHVLGSTSDSATPCEEVAGGTALAAVEFRHRQEDVRHAPGGEVVRGDGLAMSAAGPHVDEGRDQLIADEAHTRDDDLTPAGTMRASSSPS
jgi:hypothetical protein